mmetsp:Transcript_31725/g.98138  ORF Transcript_31725/g.98138 Transcript_31725/m.98138 type:complete len:230 (+) Transcript_31725:3118-3807(+)
MSLSATSSKSACIDADGLSSGFVCRGARSGAVVSPSITKRAAFGFDAAGSSAPAPGESRSGVASSIVWSGLFPVRWRRLPRLRGRDGWSRLVFEWRLDSSASAAALFWPFGVIRSSGRLLGTRFAASVSRSAWTRCCAASSACSSVRATAAARLLSVLAASAWYCAARRRYRSRSSRRWSGVSRAWKSDAMAGPGGFGFAVVSVGVFCGDPAPGPAGGRPNRGDMVAPP